jgi:hypothetical protein
MKTINDLVNENIFNSIIEELNVDDKSLYKLVKETDNYNIYFHKHFYLRKNRHSTWDNQNYISDKSVLQLIDKVYNKIIDKYNSNKLKYSKDGRESFLIFDKTKFEHLAIVGFICDLDKETEKYEICIKTAMYKDDFLPKNTNEFKTIPIILEMNNE